MIPKLLRLIGRLFFCKRERIDSSVATRTEWEFVPFDFRIDWCEPERSSSETRPAKRAEP